MESVTSSCSRTCCNHTIARCLSVPTACATRSTCSCARRASSSAGSPYISRASIWARTAANSSVVVFMFFLFPFRPVAKARPRSGACPVRFHRSPATAGSCVPLPAGALATASQSFLSTLGAGRIANDGFPAPDVLARRDNNDGDLRRQCLQRGVSQSALCSIPHRRHRAEPTRPALGRDLDLHLVLSRFPSYPSFRRLVLFVALLVLFVSLLSSFPLCSSRPWPSARWRTRLAPFAPSGPARSRPAARPDSSRSPRPANRPRQPESGPVRWATRFGGAPRGGRSDCRREQRARARTEARGLARPVVYAELDPSLERYAFPRIGRRLVSEVNTADMLGIQTPTWHVKAETASAVHQRIRALLGWAIAMNLRRTIPATACCAARPAERHRDAPAGAVPQRAWLRPSRRYARRDLDGPHQGGVRDSGAHRCPVGGSQTSLPGPRPTRRTACGLCRPCR